MFVTFLLHQTVLMESDNKCGVQGKETWKTCHTCKDVLEQYHSCMVFTFSLFNHHCCPNAIRFDGKSIVNMKCEAVMQHGQEMGICAFLKTLPPRALSHCCHHHTLNKRKTPNDQPLVTVHQSSCSSYVCEQFFSPSTTVNAPLKFVSELQLKCLLCFPKLSLQPPKGFDHGQKYF